MRLLVDMNLSTATAQFLRNYEHDVLHAREIGLATAPDTEILDYARRDSRTVITADLDYGDIAATENFGLPSIVIMRLRDQTTPAINAHLLPVLANAERPLLDGAIVVVGEERYRLRRLPISKD